MALTITDELLSNVRMTDDELLIDLACFLYDKSKLSFGRAAKFSGLNQLSFQKELAAREIHFKYNIEDFEVDLRNIGLTI